MTFLSKENMHCVVCESKNFKKLYYGNIRAGMFAVQTKKNI